MENKRIAWIDNLRGLCMIFVCFHHSGGGDSCMVREALRSHIPDIVFLCQRILVS